MRFTRTALVLAATALALGGCGGSNDGASETPGGTATSTSAVPFDQAFIDAMVPHHRDAIAMVKTANSRGLTQPDLQTIARDVVRSQQQEIDEMLEWRAEWFGSRVLGPVLPEVLGVPQGDLGMDHGGDEILAAVDPDKTFAEMMIPHHEGAIAMAKMALERAQHDDVKTLARAIVDAQEREIETMKTHAGGMHHG